MSESAATEQNPDAEQDAETSTHERSLAESAQSPERVEHVDVTEHDEVDQTALDIAESTSSDEPPA